MSVRGAAGSTVACQAADAGSIPAARSKSHVAQRQRRRAQTASSEGSNPSVATNTRRCSSVGRAPHGKREGGGSIPPGASSSWYARPRQTEREAENVR